MILSPAQYRAMGKATAAEKAAQYRAMAERYAAEAVSWAAIGENVKERSCIALAVRYNGHACKLEEVLA